MIRMDDNERQDTLDDVDDVLADVRRDLELAHLQGEIYELRALQLLLEVAKSMHTQHDVYELVALILDSALSFADADRAFLMLLTTSGDLRFKMGRSYEGTYLSENDFLISTGVVQAALDEEKAIILSDARRDTEFSKRESVQDLELRTIMAAPLRVQERLIGLIYVDSQRPLARYSKHHLSVMTSLAEQAAIAISNASKFETHHG
jgi:GAF domain-containing protein